MLIVNIMMLLVLMIMPMVVIDDILHLSVISDYTQLYAQVSTTFSRRPW